jgi:hypothetical protein
MQTQKQKMLAGELYVADDPELAEDNRRISACAAGRLQGDRLPLALVRGRRPAIPPAIRHEPAMNTQKQKMLAGELYVADDPELAEDNRRISAWLDRYNATSKVEEHAAAEADVEAVVAVEGRADVAAFADPRERLGCRPRSRRCWPASCTSPTIRNWPRTTGASRRGSTGC